MWDFPLYAVENVYYHWLTNGTLLLWPMVGQDIAKQEN